MTWVDGADAIGERLGTVAAEISREEREPRGQKLGGDSELRRVVVEEERVVVGGAGLRLLVLLSHGAAESTRTMESKTRDQGDHARTRYSVTFFIVTALDI